MHIGYLRNGRRYCCSHSCYRMWILNSTKFLNGTIFSDLEWPLNHISRSRYYSNISTSNNLKMVQYLQWLTNRKSYMVHRTASFQWPWTTHTQLSRSCHYLMLSVSETVWDTDIVIQWNTNRDLHTRVWFQVNLSDLAKRYLCDSWASCLNAQTTVFCISDQMICWNTDNFG